MYECAKILNLHPLFHTNLTMEPQTLLQTKPLLVSLFKTHPKNSLPLLIRSPECMTTTRNQVYASANPPKREKDPKKRVVVTGMGLVSVFGNNVDTYYDRLLAGENGITLIDKFDASKFPTQFGGQIRGFDSDGYIDAKTDRRLDDCQRYCIVAGKKALKDAALGGDEGSKINKDRAGVLVGTSMGGVTVFADGVECLIKRGYRKLTPFTAPYMLPNMGPAMLAMDLGFMGPNYAISAACATSNFCFYAAASHIREGNADLMIAGGVEASFVPSGIAVFSACGLLSRRNNDYKTACRPWDKDRDGFVLGEGAGVLVMESLEHAMKRDAPILVEYLGGAVNCDAYHIMSPRSDGLCVSSCIRSSLVNAGVSAEEVNYINGHATSTLIGDVAEIKALKNVFKKIEGIKINATKSMIGHALGAAGGLEAIATIKAIQTGWLHPSINQFNKEPQIEFDTVANQKQQHEINVGKFVSSSLSFIYHELLTFSNIFGMQPFRIHLVLADKTPLLHFRLSNLDMLIRIYVQLINEEHHIIVEVQNPGDRGSILSALETQGPNRSPLLPHGFALELPSPGHNPKRVSPGEVSTHLRRSASFPSPADVGRAVTLSPPPLRTQRLRCAHLPGPSSDTISNSPGDRGSISSALETQGPNRSPLLPHGFALELPSPGYNPKRVSPGKVSTHLIRSVLFPSPADVRRAVTQGVN
ncbi:hypothetical protein OSB04_012860 [Centaurea solstitialis]|uniref:3-oxoacyl-[acyl-carrier-protein] synthase I, chloroplastic n=1 Tax=Centaurea solstitialis TaxID=347529 RepID=A0AA38WQX4_9ASTR|nr:hypothetical protein OSB04_012860 [Centaurea solstitialis]